MLADLQSRLAKVESLIQRLEGQDDVYLRAVGEHFHLGMVGADGRNARQLNQRREKAIDRTIDRAKRLSALYQERADLWRKIQDVENGGPAKRTAAGATGPVGEAG